MGRGCVLEGEIVCLDSNSKPQFRDPLFRRAEPVFYAFDILWDEHAKSNDEEENRRFRNSEDLRYVPLLTASSDFMPWFRSAAKVFFTAITLTKTASGYSILPVSTTLKVSWRSANPIHNCQSMQTGRRSGIRTILNGLGARSYLSASADAILIFTSGMDVLSCVKVRMSRKRKEREQFRSRSKTYLHFNSTWITSNDFLLVFSGR